MTHSRQTHFIMISHQKSTFVIHIWKICFLKESIDSSYTKHIDIFSLFSNMFSYETLFYRIGNQYSDGVFRILIHLFSYQTRFNWNCHTDDCFEMKPISTMNVHYLLVQLVGLILKLGSVVMHRNCIRVCHYPLYLVSSILYYLIRF